MDWLPWQNDFTYWWISASGEIVEAASLSDVPEGDDIEFARICDAVAYFNKCGCVGWSAHVVRNEYHRLCLHVLRQAVERHGQEYTVYRGHRGEWSLDQHKILYGALDRKVAEFYGDIVDAYTVKGLLTHSHAKSVLTDSIEDSDDEIIFFPDTVLQCC